MIWFNGDVSNPDWMIGPSTDFNQGQFTYGYMQSNDDTTCPEYSEEWEEWWSSEWTLNQEAFVRPHSPILGLNII